MEFKGTKGKWYSEYKSGYWKITDDEREGSIAEVYFFNDGKDTAEHNAKLIEKAPEMLEMLNKCMLELAMYKSEFGQGSKLQEDISKLIKQIVEL